MKLAALTLLAFISLATYSFFTSGGIDATSALKSYPEDTILRIDTSDYTRARLGWYWNNGKETYGRLPVGTSDNIEQANYSPFGNYGNIQGSGNIQ